MTLFSKRKDGVLENQASILKECIDTVDVLYEG